MAPYAAAHDAEEIRRKKRSKLILYIVLFVVFQTGVILIFSFTVMKIRAPKFRLSAAVITNIAAATPANSSFTSTVKANLAVRNTNFGRYKYESTTVEFLYGGAPAGKATVDSSRANMRSTKKLEIEVDLNLAASTQVASDLRDGVLRLSSRAKMMGKVELFFVMKKKKSATMNCSMELVIATQQIRNIACE
ncbi:hypothetical protein CASFOL_003259 [Castilleja foliolosa]|uniref:Late embryogenesis abundant protein LEA-2 subgroup domain-containing protein n=1 Tax=Castilleja foliolosa TaxID=1961234 RepID=A0ABD3EGM6_9LAMI